MSEADGVRVSVGCDCGHQFQVSIGGVDLETFRFTCPGCGEEEGFTTEQVDKLVSAHGAAADYAAGTVRDSIKGLKK